MKTYWDYTEKERSEMTEENVRALLDTELMTKGVLKVEDVKLREVPTVQIDKETWYEVNGVLFKTAEQAAKFLELDPHRSNYNYSYGSEFSYAEPIDTYYRDIKQVKMCNRTQVMNLGKTLAEIKQAREHNEKATASQGEAMKAVDKVLCGVWEDWYAQQAQAKRHEKIIQTFKEYEKMTDGDTAMAMEFLKKAFTEDEIQEANAWFGIMQPSGDRVQN